MKEDRTSITQRIAIRRAAHQLLNNPKVLDDPVALRIIGKETTSALQVDPHKFENTPLPPYLHTFVNARSRYVEDELALGIQHGLCQYVILGAGLDTFACHRAGNINRRNHYPAHWI
jgi:O-methyltransferase involved in polyketide biosynthesis